MAPEDGASGMERRDLDVVDDVEPGKAALAAYSPLFEADPESGPAANMTGRSLEALGRLDEARAHWELVIELQPQNTVARERARRLKHRPRTEQHGDGSPMVDLLEIQAYYLATTDRMRLFLDELARHPGRRRTNPQMEAALGWNELSVRGTASASARRVGLDTHEGRLPYHWAEGDSSQSGRFETWMDAQQAAAITAVADPRR